MKRDTRTAYRARAAATERSVDAALADVKAQQEAERAEAQAAWSKRYAPVPFTAEELKAARTIRTALGLHAVVRVNAKSVTVKTAYSWTDRVSIDKIIEVWA